MPDKPVQALKGRVVRCILFDLGETLWTRGDVDTWEQLEASANLRAAAVLREHVPSQLLANLDDLALGSRLRDAFNQNVRTSIRHHPNIDPGGTSVAMETLLQWGIKGDDLMLGNAIFEALRVRIPESRPLFEDTLSTLAVLQQRNFLLGVVTNRVWGGQPFQEDMQTLGLHHYFDLRTIAVSADLGVRKPDPAIFNHALNALKVAPEEAVMVGDSLSADIIGAQGLGIFAIWKPKAKFRERIKAHSLAHRGSSDVYNAQQTLPELEIFSEELSANGSPSGLIVTGDDYVLTSKSHSNSLEMYLSGEIVPDLIIHHLSELLNLFTEIGVQ